MDGNIGASIINIIGLVTIGVVAHFYKKWDTERKKKNAINRYDNQLDYRVKIDELVDKIQAVSNASRVNVFEYSNTEKSIGGACKLFVSCTSESLDRFTKSIWDEFQHKPITRVLRVIIQRIKKSQDLYLKITVNQEDFEIKNAFQQYGTQICYNFKLGEEVWDSGILTMSWIGNPDVEPKDLSTEQLKYVLLYIEDIKKIKEELLK